MFSRAELVARLRASAVCGSLALVVLSNAPPETRAAVPHMSYSGAFNFYSATIGVLSDGDRVPVVDAIEFDSTHAVIGWRRQDSFGVTIVRDDGRGLVRMADCEESLCITYGSRKGNFAEVEDSRPGATSTMLRSLGLSEGLVTSARRLPTIVYGDAETERLRHAPIQPIIVEHNFFGWALGPSGRVVDLDVFQLRGCRARLSIGADADTGDGYQVTLDPSQRFCAVRLRAYGNTTRVAADVMYEAWLPNPSFARRVGVAVVDQSSGSRRLVVAKVVGNKVTAHIPSSVIHASWDALRLQIRR